MSLARGGGDSPVFVRFSNGKVERPSDVVDISKKQRLHLPLRGKVLLSGLRGGQFEVQNGLSQPATHKSQACKLPVSLIKQIDYATKLQVAERTQGPFPQFPVIWRVVGRMGRGRAMWPSPGQGPACRGRVFFAALRSLSQPNLAVWLMVWLIVFYKNDPVMQ